MFPCEAIADLPVGLVVGTMCHCDEPDECDDHWEFFVVDNPDSVPASGHVGRGRPLTERQMRAVAALVRRESEE